MHFLPPITYVYGAFTVKKTHVIISVIGKCYLYFILVRSYAGMVCIHIPLDIKV